MPESKPTARPARANAVRPAATDEAAAALVGDPGAVAATAVKLHELDSEFVAALRDRARLAPFKNYVPTLPGLATQAYDGRKRRLVLGVVHDEAGASRGGIEARLLDATGHMLDRTFTDPTGLFLLRYPIGESEAAELNGKLVVGGKPQPNFRVPAHRQHTVIDVSISPLPEPTPHAPVPNPLNRLPADFSMSLCDDLRRLRTTLLDPILGHLAPEGDFRAERLPLVKRFTVPVVGEAPAHARYLVRVRQEWMFAGYTLGEIDEVDSLDPGMVLEERTDTFQRAVSQASRAASLSTIEEETEVRSLLQRLSSVDQLVTVTQTPSVQKHSDGYSTVGGILGGVLGFGVGSLFGGGGAGAGVGSKLGGWIGGLFGGGDHGASPFTSSTRTDTDTSLRVNTYLHTSRSLVNSQIRTATSMLRSVSVRHSRELEQVSPLLSRVTNLMRWTLYENYIVSTSVEDVVQVRRQRVVKPRPLVGALFTDADIVEYRRFFEPLLLEPRLRPHFEHLRQAVELRRTGGLPIRTVHVAVDYSATIGSADLQMSVGGREIRLRLAPGDTEVRGTLVLDRPIKANELDSATFELNGRAQFMGFAPLLNVQVSRLRFWYDTPHAAAPDQAVRMADRLKVTLQDPNATCRLDLQPKPRFVDTSQDELFLHVHRNETYYFGVLLQAAYHHPHLRSDARQLASIGPDSELWQLPILGFEGLDVLYLGEPEGVTPENVRVKDKEVARLIGDPGAATIIQIAAPGAYSEALQGLLSLKDAEGRIHPALLPRPLIAQPMTVTELASPVTVNGELIGTGAGADAPEKVPAGS